MVNPNVCILNAPGINCNVETGTMFEMAQYELHPLEDTLVEQVHMSQWYNGTKSLADFQILALPGGFSHGDDIAAGRILGVELRSHFKDDLNNFVKAGGLVLAICNGDQIAVETGLIPAGVVTEARDKSTALATNANGTFDDRWGHLLVNESRCLFVDPEELGQVIELPWAHGEGRFQQRTDDDYAALFTNRQIVFQYATAAGLVSVQFPENPSGSPFGIAGVCDPTGQILGMMPHPERFVDPMQHPDVRIREIGEPTGLVIAKRMVSVALAA